MIPLGAESPSLRTPWMTLFILGGMFAVWILVQGASVYGRWASSILRILVSREAYFPRPSGLSIPKGLAINVSPNRRPA